MGVFRERDEVIRVRRESRSSWFGKRHYQRVHRRASAGTVPEQSCPSSQLLRDVLDDVACFEQSIGQGISDGMPLKRLDQDGVGTSGGHSPSALRARMSAAARWDRSDSRERPPESRTSTC